MNFEEQLLVGGLLMAVAVFAASHAHARPVPAKSQPARISPASPAQARTALPAMDR